MLSHNGTLFDFSQIKAQHEELKYNLLNINKFQKLKGIGYDKSYRVATPAQYALLFQNNNDSKNALNSTNQSITKKQMKTVDTQTENYVTNASTSTCVTTKNQETQVEKSIFRILTDLIFNLFR